MSRAPLRDLYLGHSYELITQQIAFKIITFCFGLCAGQIVGEVCLSKNLVNIIDSHHSGWFL